MFDDKTIIITGGTGSFGHKCTEYLLNNFSPKKLIIMSRDEMKQWEMAQRYAPERYKCMRYFIGDVRDKARLYRAFDGVDFVIHAAALKIVPTAEYNPFEYIQTNVVGAQNVIEAAIDKQVKRLVAISTDKASNPINLYGATKLCSDKLFLAGNSYSGTSKTRFSVVRYGNVVGSRGSVIPFFRKMRENGKLPITDPRMTRFWITMRQGVRFVLQALQIMQGGEIFVPKLPSMNIMDLAQAIAPECQIKLVGIRPGEKVHEVLLPYDEAKYSMEHNGFYIVRTREKPEQRLNRSEGTPLPDDFEYSSGTNNQWLSVEELREMVEKL
jgi:UDP-N-acetylglucosamine 4,6-dehydratase